MADGRLISGSDHLWVRSGRPTGWSIWAVGFLKGIGWNFNDHGSFGNNVAGREQA